jgi:hypothetical protein
MTSNVDQVEEAWLDGSTEFDRVMGEFEVEFMAPFQLRMMKIAWATMTDQEKEGLRRDFPEAFATVEKQMKTLIKEK